MRLEDRDTAKLRPPPWPSAFRLAGVTFPLSRRHAGVKLLRTLTWLLWGASCVPLPQVRGQVNYATPYTFSTIAGNAGYGIADGVGSTARFFDPQGIAADRAGNIYVGDAKNFTIRMMVPTVFAGQTNWVVSTIAGSPGVQGTADGAGGVARFIDPHGLTLDGVGNLFLTEFAGHTIREISPVVSAGQTNWVVSTIAGATGVKGSQDGLGGAARFFQPSCLAWGGGNLYVVDEGNATIRMLAPFVAAGQTNWQVSTIAGLAGSHGSTDGDGSIARFHIPFGIAADLAGDLYVTDYAASTIRLLTPTGQTNWQVSTIAGSVGGFGSVDGTGTNAQFLDPFGITVNADGTLFVDDAGNNTIRSITPQVSDGVTNWLVSTIAGLPGVGGQGSTDGTGSEALFWYPNEIAVDTGGVLYVTDTFNNTIRRLTPSATVGQTGWTVNTIAGLAAADGSLDGIGSSAAFVAPDGVALDQAGNLYVTDFTDCIIRRLAPVVVGGKTNWSVTTIAGSAGVNASNDGTGSSAFFDSPDGIAVDGLGQVYVADSANETIRKISPTLVAGQTQWVVSTIAGSVGVSGTNDGTGGLAQFAGLGSIAVDRGGNLFVPDSGNATIRMVRPIVASGHTNWNVTTIAGLATVTGSDDGTGTVARFNAPYGITMGPAGNLYVTDGANNTIRRIAPNILPGLTNWVVTTIAGTAGTNGNVDGVGAAAQFNAPSGIAMDAAGALYVADAQNNTLRKVAPSRHGSQTNWAVTTIGGLGGHFGSADGTGAAARFNSPWGVAVSPDGKVYVADYYNTTVRQGVSPPVIRLSTPSLSPPQARIGFALTAGWASTFELLNAPSPRGPWATNTAGLLATNTLGVSYSFTVPWNQAAAQFFRVQSP